MGPYSPVECALYPELPNNNRSLLWMCAKFTVSDAICFRRKPPTIQQMGSSRAVKDLCISSAQKNFWSREGALLSGLKKKAIDNELRYLRIDEPLNATGRYRSSLAMPDCLKGQRQPPNPLAKYRSSCWWCLSGTIHQQSTFICGAPLWASAE